MYVDINLLSPFSPYRIVDDCGGAFSMGAIGGSIFHGIAGIRNAPKVIKTFNVFDIYAKVNVAFSCYFGL